MLLKNTPSTRYPCPSGAHLGICINVIDLGIQASHFENGDHHQVAILIEVDKRIEAGPHKGKRHLVSQVYNVSLHEKSNLRKTLTLWYGKDPCTTVDGVTAFDLDAVKGRPCIVTVVHGGENGSTYANVRSISQCPDGMQALTPETPSDHIPAWLAAKRENRLDKAEKRLPQSTPVANCGAETSTKDNASDMWQQS